MKWIEVVGELQGEKGFVAIRGLGLQKEWMSVTAGMWAEAQESGMLICT